MTDEEKRAFIRRASEASDAAFTDEAVQKGAKALLAAIQVAMAELPEGVTAGLALGAVVKGGVARGTPAGRTLRSIGMALGVDSRLVSLEDMDELREGFFRTRGDGVQSDGSGKWSAGCDCAECRGLRARAAELAGS